MENQEQPSDVQLPPDWTQLAISATAKFRPQDLVVERYVVRLGKVGCEDRILELRDPTEATKAANDGLRDKWKVLGFNNIAAHPVILHGKGR